MIVSVFSPPSVLSCMQAEPVGAGRWMLLNASDFIAAPSAGLVGPQHSCGGAWYFLAGRRSKQPRCVFLSGGGVGGEKV